MRTIKHYIWILLAGMLVSSCIERYYPDSELNFRPKLVIDGLLATDDGPQEIIISQSSPSEDPKLIPVSKCTVFVEDDKGNRFTFSESANKGHYFGKLEGNPIVIGGRYRLHVKTTDGKEYASNFEELMPCPDVDAVYYELETRQTTDRDITEKGLQFFIDFKGNENYGRYFRWQLTQTYEYHSTWPLDRWLDWDGYHDLPRTDYSNFVCYKTDKLKDIFVLSTAGFSQNTYSHYKLHFVKDQTQELQHKYSLLVRQYSLTESAYNYWENLRKNNQENVNLFGRQPANVKGNIRNVSDSTDVALGYFGISAIRSKRIIVNPIDGLSFNDVYRCRALVIDGPIPPDDRPVYFADDEDGFGVKYTGRAGPECIFCTMLGGTTDKPDYWDEK
jgi:hypothetical protein